MSKYRVLLINRFLPNFPHYQAERSAIEIFKLVETLGDAMVVDMIHQYGFPMFRMYIGPQQAENIANQIKTGNIDTVVINGLLKPRQIFNLTMYWLSLGLKVTVWDRMDLILHIFEIHAHTREALLQIRLAKARHMGPAMYGVGKILSQQGGGIGMRGIGETNLELMKRHWRQEIRTVNNELQKIQNIRLNQLRKRKSLGFLTVSLVGYTNAGKTTLFNRLTDKRKVVGNYLFATLDSVVGLIPNDKGSKKILITDTIGFIEELPPNVIDAFKSTLMETVNADLILHVIDQSDPYLNEKIDTVERILTDMGIDRKSRIFVFNKSDIAKRGLKGRLTKAFSRYKPIFISAQQDIGINMLIQRIEKLLS